MSTTERPVTPAVPSPEERTLGPSKVFVAGERGLLGSAIVRRLRRQPDVRCVTTAEEARDLRIESNVERLFSEEAPDVVFLCAARVGGIHANSTYPVEFLEDNLAIYTNVVRAAYRHRVRRLVFLGSNCAYPRAAAQPIVEDALFTGPCEPTNSAFAAAKLAGIELCRAYNQQHGTRFLAAMPASLFGPGDNYDPQRSHVVAAMIRRFVSAKAEERPVETIWGTGSARRELLYVDDCADACVFLAALPDTALDALLAEHRYPVLNVGGGVERTILQLAHEVADVVGYRGRIETDPSKPDGAPRKALDGSRLASLGWEPRVPFREGLQRSVADFLQRMATAGAGR